MKQVLRIIGAAALCAVGSLTASTQGTVETNLNFYKGVLSSSLSTVKPVFVVGANSIGASPTEDQKARTLARTELDGAIGSQTVKVTPLAPSTATVNGVAAQPNPLNGAGNSNLLLYQGIYPVVLAVDNKTIVMVTDTNAGSTLLSVGTVNDAGGTAVANTVAGLTASDDQAYFFAAVSATAKAWSDKDTGALNRGIAVIKPSLAALTPLDATDLTNATPGNKALKVDLTTAEPTVLPAPVGYVSFKGASLLNPHIANTATAELFSNNVAMHWNPTLKRLYVGLNKVKRDDFAKEGGIMGLFMGYIATDATPKTALNVVPFISGLQRGLFYEKPSTDFFYNSDSKIIGFYYDGMTRADLNSANNGFDDVEVSIKKINSMHTSTEYDYLIIHSSVGVAGKSREGVYALPLLGENDANGVPFNDPNKVGSLSAIDATTKVATFNEPPSSQSTFISNDVASIKICDASDSLTDLFVVGDTVFMCMSGPTTATMGIWASSAIFNEKGIIAGWSAPYRLGGTIDRVMSGAIDLNTLSFYMLTAQTNDAASADFNTFNKIQVTNWGQTDKVTYAPSVNNLSVLLKTLFPVADGGLVGFTVFDAQTPGIKMGSMVMGAALGLNKVALIQLGKRVNGLLVAETTFTLNTNVFVFDAATIPELKAIAPLTCVEVSRMTTADSGWLFVGGYNGVAVLSNNTAATADPFADSMTGSVIGRGWASARGLSALRGDNINAFPSGDLATPTTNWTFKKLAVASTDATPVTSLFNVRKMIAVNGNLNVVTLYGLYSLQMTGGNFSAAIPATTPITTPVISMTSFTGFPAGTTVLADCLVVKDSTGTLSGVVATNNGLFSANFTAKTVVAASSLTDKFVRSLQVIGHDSPLPSTLQDIYAMTVDRVADNDMLYSFNSNDKLFEFNASRWGFMTNGTHVYSFMPKQYDNAAVVTAGTIGTDTVIDLTEDLTVGNDTNAFPYAIVRNTLNGAPYVISDQGFDVNQ